MRGKSTMANINTLAMSAEEFRANVDSGKVPVDSHDRLLKMACIYLDEALYDGRGVFPIVDELHTRGWSFGRGDLKFNRTLDIFYLAQLAAGMYLCSDQDEGEFATADDFDRIRAEHGRLFDEDAWKEYYSAALLARPVTARFYRLPDLQDLADSSGPLEQPRRDKANADRHATKLPRWAHCVARTIRRQPALPAETVVRIALDTLRQTTACLREAHPGSVRPYSETQARFWLGYMKADDPGKRSRDAWNPDEFGIHAAQGGFDMWAWEAHYSRALWESFDGTRREPDLDGTRRSEVEWCGWPDGGVGEQARGRGWEPELGSEEEIAFLAAVAARETEGVDGDMDVDVVAGLDFAVRSHILLGVLHAAFEAGGEGGQERVEELKQRMVGAGRIDEGRAERWIREALKVMEPYVLREKSNGWPASAEGRGELLRRVLEENGQLFARWRLSESSKEFNFELGPRE